MLRDALAETSRVDLLVLSSEEIPDWDTKAVVGYDEAHHLQMSEGPRSALGRIFDTCFGESLSRSLRYRRRSRELVEELQERRGYSVVLSVREDCFAAIGRIQSASNVVDVDDLMHTVVRRGRFLGRDERGNRVNVVGRAASWLRENVYRLLHAYVMRRADHLLFASSQDVESSSSPRDRSRCAVVPNSVPEAAWRSISDRPPVREPAVILFQGLMLYGPNVDGARWFVEHVLPVLRENISIEIRLRIVGKHSGALSELANEDGVCIVGEVEDMSTELSGADLVVVPIRVGGGTRIKILEALAAGVPVVSTTTGAEGLALRDGVELLVADEPLSFAAACASLLSDSRMREQMVSAGSARVGGLYRREDIVRQAAQLFESGSPERSLDARSSLEWDTRSASSTGGRPSRCGRLR